MLGRSSTVIENAGREFAVPLDAPGQLALVLRKQVGLTDNDIARATGASQRSVRRWVAGGAVRAEHADKLDDLRTIVALLAASLPAPVIVNWLRGRNSVLTHQ